MIKVDDFHCDNIGRFAHPDNCEKYYFCWDIDGIYAIFICPHKKAFDPVTQRCVYDFAACAVAPKCSVDKRILPNLNDKSTFFACKFRHLSKQFVLRKRNCADGREFNADLGYCESKILDDNISTDNSDSSEIMECEKPGVFIDYSQSNRFACYECKVKSVSKGTFKLMRHKCSNHSFIVDKNDSLSLKCACLNLQLLTLLFLCTVNVTIRMQS